VHELYLAECILRSARQALPPGVEPEAVERILVRVGKLDAVMPESLVFLFDATKSSQGFTDAKLELVEEEVRALCTGCGSEFELAEPVFICPSCGSGNVRIVKGRGLFLEKIMIRDEVLSGNSHST
jgi:hydrogenase nickel incorporation protein HypA/HybF